MTEVNYGDCEKCGGPNKLSTKGNVYCSKMCWKNGPTPAGNAPRQYQPRTLANDPNRLSDKEKAEGASFGNSKTCASNLLAAAIASNQKTFEEAMNLFEGTAQRIYDTNDKTQTSGA